GLGADVEVDRAGVLLEQLVRLARRHLSDVHAPLLPEGDRQCSRSSRKTADRRDRAGAQVSISDSSLQNRQRSQRGRSERRTIGTAAVTTFRSGLRERATPSMVTIALMRSVADGGT